MRPKSLILLALALGCGLVASIGISQVLESRRQQKDASAEQTNILVALDDVERNAELNAKNVVLKPWPKSQVPQGAITKLDEVIGRRPNTRIIKDEPILEGKLGTGEGGTRAAGEIPVGFRAVPVRVDSAQNTGLILPGDRVDVQVFVNKGPNVPEATTSTFLEDVSVFAVNSEIRHDPSTDTKIDAKTVSLLVTPEQAAKLTLAAEVGTIRLILRGSHTEASKGAIKVTLPGILGGTDENGSNKGGEPAPDLKKFLDQQQVAKASDAPPADDDVYRMIIVHGQDAHIEEIHKGELMSHKIDGAVPPAAEPQHSSSGSDVATGAPAAGSAATNDSPATKKNTPPTTSPTTLPSGPASGQDGTLHRVQPAR